MKVQTDTLIGPTLDWAVIVALHGKHEWDNPKHVAHFNEIRNGHTLHQQAHYSTNWSQGGPIIDEYDIDVLRDGKEFGARLGSMRKHPQRDVMSWFPTRGPTKLIAAMRCFVASRLGDEVDVPEELL